ncbi:MAG: hypothetical protein ACLFSZ_07145 [Puniceicoccaceae bacterium]
MTAPDRNIPIPPIAPPESASLEAVRGAFSDSPEWIFAQHWRPTPEAEFQPASLKAGWCPAYLHFLASFSDHDIVVLENHSSRSRLAVCDVFQVFLGRPEADEYFEIHVTPNNRNQVLGWTAGRFSAFVDGATSLDDILVDCGHPPVSDTWVEEENSRWTAYLRIPVKMADPAKKHFTPETVLTGTFCRYDVSPGSPAPVLSSTSPFPEKPKFHDNRHWHRLCLEPGGNDRG